MRLLMLLLPERFFYADHLTVSARRLGLRMLVALAGLVAAAIALGLLNADNWRDVAAGALFAWSASFIVWAVSSYRAGTDEVAKELRHMAELDLLHGRLNHLAADRGLPLLDLQGEIEAVLEVREERLAHFAGLDEFRPVDEPATSEWWDEIALGRRDVEGPQ